MKFKITTQVEADSKDQAEKFAETFGGTPGAQWDSPPEAETLAVEEVANKGQREGEGDDDGLTEYTVLARYPDNNQDYTETVRARDAEHAEQVALEQCRADNQDPELTLDMIAVIKGDVEIAN